MRWISLTLGLLIVGLVTNGCDGGSDMTDTKAPISAPTLDGTPAVVIAHRGASGYLPEHTIEGYARAIEMGADYIEPDLVITSDGVLVARHDNYLSTTTDVEDHPEFAGRRRYVEALDRTDWWVEDFTLAEIKTLRARQPYTGRSGKYDGRFEIPTFDEIMALAKAQSEARSEAIGREIGVYPETKHPSHFAGLGLDFQAPLLETLARYGYGDAGSKVFIQSFEPGILQELRGKTPLPLIMLLYQKSEDDPDADETEPNLPFEAFASFVDGVGPDRNLLIDDDGKDTGFVARAHALGLKVHPWTFRVETVPRLRYGSYAAELRAYLALGIDGFFTDFADLGVAVVADMAAGIEAGIEPEPEAGD